MIYARINKMSTEDKEELMASNKVTLAPILRLKDIIGNYIFNNCSLGYDGEINLLFSKTKLDNRSEDKCLYKIFPDKPQNYKLLIVMSSGIKIFSLTNQTMNYSYASQVSKNEYLFVCPQAIFYNQNDFDKNCRIFNDEGNLIHEFTIGNGVDDIQINSRNEIWVSYSDEGIFGNYGWICPIGSSGLNCFNKNGDLIYEFSSQDEDSIVEDCTSLNVCSKDDVYFFGFAEKEYLAKLTNKKLMRQWHLPITSTPHFSIDYPLLLLDLGSGSGFFTLHDLEKNLDYCNYEFYNENGDIIMKSCHSQKDSIYFWDKYNLYQQRIGELVA